MGGIRKDSWMGIIIFAYIVFLWGIPVLITWRSYRKLGDAERREFIKELKDPVTIFGIAPASIGLLFFGWLE